MKKSVIFMVLSLLLVIFWPRGDEAIYDSVIRFHVIANSDSAPDQQVKLKVRDALIRYAGSLEPAADLNSAEAQINENLNIFEEIANRVLAENGLTYRACAVLSREFYPRREYLTFRLPGGEYRSLRVILGDGNGQNWWCVLFPPVCLDSSSFEEEMTRTGVNKETVKILKKENREYEIRFFIVELFEQLKKRF